MATSRRYCLNWIFVALDWRDTLMSSGLEYADYEEQLDRLLGPIRYPKSYRGTHTCSEKQKLY